MSEPALHEGSLIAGRYRLEQRLGEGAMGTVWAATHSVTRRSVAMKFLKESVRHRQDLQERFFREAAAASALEHPNVVEVIDIFDLAEGCPVMVMERLYGETLRVRLQREERLSVQQTAALLLPVVSAVGAAHAIGIVHRDLKPDNLFLLDGGAAPGVKVLDFGIAKLSAERFLRDGPSALVTELGSILGTPCYMAPEQASGEQAVDHRADIWSLGVILYECLSGVRPIEGENVPQVVARLMNAGITPLERIAPEVPPEVARLVQQLLTRELSRRPNSLLEVSRCLSRFTSVRAPELPAPAGAVAPPSTPSDLALARAPSRVALQERTLLSSPPVDGSLLLTAPEPSWRVPLRYGGAFAALLLAGAVWVSSERPNPRTAQGNPALLPTRPAAPPRVAAEVATSVVSAVPAHSATAAAAKRSLKASFKSGAPSAPNAEHVDGSEEALFRGRK